MLIDLSSKLSSNVLRIKQHRPILFTIIIKCAEIVRLTLKYKQIGINRREII